ncbi:MAG: ABC transporter permease [Verrucomicrobia bacterium]|nr:ABC transporter permease [Verrucomicrobiota bacterium]
MLRVAWFFVVSARRRLLFALGGWFLGGWRYSRHVLAVVTTLALVSVRPRFWPSTARNIFARQILQIGVGSILFILILGGLVGAVAVVQAAGWAQGILQVQLLNPLLVVVVARELGPLFANLIVFSKDGTSTTSEVGLMKLSGEIRLLEAQGIDPLTYFLLPKMCGAAVASFCLTILFIGVAFLAGFFVGTAIGHINVSLEHFFSDTLRSLELVDWVVLVIKSMVPAAIQSVICATHGLQISSPAGLAGATRLAASRSLAAVFTVSTITSLVAYG